MELKKIAGHALDSLTGFGEIEVRTYKSNAELRRGLNRMQRRGYEVSSHTTSAKRWSMLTGFLTRKQIHTVVFERPNDDEFYGES